MPGNYDRKDYLHQRAKEEGYRSRAAYKLIELNKKYRFLLPGNKVLDLGCWPGGWMQVASAAVGERGRVVGVDLVEPEPLNLGNATFIQGDMLDSETVQKAISAAGGSFDVVLSDMSPKLSGIPEVDRNGVVHLAQAALEVARSTLSRKGTFVAKLFKGNETEQFVKSVRPLFNKVLRCELDATRKSSNEYYLIAFAPKIS